MDLQGKTFEEQIAILDKGWMSLRQRRVYVNYIIDKMELDIERDW